MTAVIGEASWFCCGTAWGPCGSAGGGACGNCSSSKHQHAWPAASSACLSITNPAACGVGLTQRGCGFVHYVTNRCNGKEVASSIADCGPNTHQFCGEKSCCGSTCGTNRLVDLTASAFSAISSLSNGLIPVKIDTVA
ncbi:MAG: hypothetical protein HOV83_10570 [Catenulispora sp.]|nr:hypothetical protein [Catenulispora sp.]